MAVVARASTTFQRSEVWRIATEKETCAGASSGCPTRQISDHLKRAVIASETTASPATTAWTGRRSRKPGRATATGRRSSRTGPRTRCALAPEAPKIVGGSHHHPAAGQEPAAVGRAHVAAQGPGICAHHGTGVAAAKQRILEIYPNSVEWGEGVFGAEAARSTTGEKARQSSALGGRTAGRDAARPKRFEKMPASGYLSSRANTIVTARMGDAELP